MISPASVIGELLPTLPWIAVCAGAGIGGALLRGRIGLPADLVIAAAAVMAVASVAGDVIHLGLGALAPSALSSAPLMLGIAVALRVVATASMVLLAAAAAQGRLAR